MYKLPNKLTLNITQPEKVIPTARDLVYFNRMVILLEYSQTILFMKYQHKHKGTLLVCYIS